MLYIRAEQKKLLLVSPVHKAQLLQTDLEFMKKTLLFRSLSYHSISVRESLVNQDPRRDLTESPDYMDRQENLLSGKRSRHVFLSDI